MCYGPVEVMNINLAVKTEEFAAFVDCQIDSPSSIDNYKDSAFTVNTGVELHDAAVESMVFAASLAVVSSLI